MDYFTKWLEVVALKFVDYIQIIHFLEEIIMSRFRVLKKFVIDNGSILWGHDLLFYVECMSP
jgi:hypothetical protein